MEEIVSILMRRDRLGKKLWKKIKLLHECDELAH